jgi:hypothetical protein
MAWTRLDYAFPVYQMVTILAFRTPSGIMAHPEGPRKDGRNADGD